MTFKKKKPPIRWNHKIDSLSRLVLSKKGDPYVRHSIDWKNKYTSTKIDQNYGIFYLKKYFEENVKDQIEFNYATIKDNKTDISIEHYSTSHRVWFDDLTWKKNAEDIKNKKSLLWAWIHFTSDEQKERLSRNKKNTENILSSEMLIEPGNLVIALATLIKAVNGIKGKTKVIVFHQKTKQYLGRIEHAKFFPHKSYWIDLVKNSQKQSV